MLDFSKAEFCYEPFPIGRAQGVFAVDLYEELINTFPPIELFDHKVHAKDDKYTLNEVKTQKAYHDWIHTHPAWREFHRWVKSKEFPRYIFGVLKQHNLKLGIAVDRPPLKTQARRILSDIIRRRRYPRFERSLYTRFEFSALAADGGFICPHTDAPSKIVTLVISMVRDGTWDPSIGGGLTMNRAKRPEDSFNYVNHFLPFDAVEPIRTFEFIPNQCVIFIKTFNSYHSVAPMRAAGSALFRRTITVNIEYE